MLRLADPSSVIPVVFALTLVQCPQGRDKRGPATA